MTRYLTTEQALRIARTAVGAPIEVRDIGLLDAAVHRPRASVLGQDAYRDLPTKAAALLHSLCTNHALVDGNKRLAWLATYVLCAKNGLHLNPSDDDAYELVIRIAAGDLADLGEIAKQLASFARLDTPSRAATAGRVERDRTFEVRLATWRLGDADGTGQAGAAEAAVAVRHLVEVLLVVVPSFVA